MSLAIDTADLTKRFGTFTAVNAVTIHVAEGETYGFLGANGAGKTTAIRMLCGLLRPSSGVGHVAGHDIITETARIRSSIGYVSQKFSLYRDLRVVENMKLYGSLYGLAGTKLAQRIADSARFLGMESMLERRTGSLPPGWRQRLSLACANLHEPRILFLDEPTGSVDPVSRGMFWNFIRSLAKGGTTIFMTTHHMDEAEYCDRVSLMVDGSIAVVDSPAALKKEFACEDLNEVFIKVAESAA